MKTELLIGTLAFVTAIQIIPFGHDHTNPPVMAEPAWDTPQTRTLFMRACADCHSNETVWPWYSHVAPVSWLVAHDVEEGREHFNVSLWGVQKKNDGDEAAEEVEENEMPPLVYLPTHPEARLTPEEKTALIAGLKATFGTEKHGH
ncbi:heme-binding domain-containing protein [Sulfurimonas sp. HSL1-6]|uniref:heme-binding domain-containing protein n=1 Tax=Thiomicrolovo immobilis TaxID=3131935 RepID=UPI0031F9C93E